MSRYDEIRRDLENRKERIENGLYNCIPLPFQRFSEVFPGFEKEKYIVVTANQKVGKSKLCDYLFIYEPLFFMMEHPELKIKVLYFTLEMSPKEKYNEFLSYLLYRLDNIEISTKELKSIDKNHPLPQHIIDLLDDEIHQKYIKAYEDMVIYNDEDRNPTGINKVCREYMLSRGHLNYETFEKINKETGESFNARKVDHINPYTPEDPEEIVLAIVDNASNLTPENGMKKMETIDKLSKYAITLRNQLKMIFVLIQHQAQAQEGIENFKLGKLKPSSDGLADCKTTTRDFRR